MDKVNLTPVEEATWPDWKDSGRRVEMQMDNGAIIQGELFVADFFPDCQGDEIPMFSVRADDGAEHAFTDHKQWRFL